jgi:hypothetical protein
LGAAGVLVSAPAESYSVMGSGPPPTAPGDGYSVMGVGPPPTMMTAQRLNPASHHAQTAASFMCTGGECAL